MFQNENDPYTPLITRIMLVEDITWGENKNTYLVRYRGKIYSEDTSAVYDQLIDALKPYHVTPLFRQHQGQHIILLMEGVIQAKPSKVWVNALMFALTVVSVILAGAFYSFELQDGFPATLQEWLQFLPGFFFSGFPFAVSLLAILLAHEFGHYIAGRLNKTQVTLPYFIPLPFVSPLGTMGAFIQVKEIPKNRNIMLDIGIAGPLAGLIVAIPVLLIGLYLSPINDLPVRLPENQILSLEGNSILYLGLKYIVKGELLPAPVSYGNLPEWMYWVRYFITGSPLPLGGRDILMHPVAWAGWAGLLVTALNLIPAGQLDGGHILYVLLGKRAAQFVPVIILILVGLGFFWSGWWLWAGLIFFLGRSHMEPLDQITPLDARRKLVAFLAIIIFFLVFMPVPMIQYTGGI